MNPNTMNDILNAVKSAREKHPKFADYPQQAVCIITEELGEMAQAINDADKSEHFSPKEAKHFRHAKEEALHVIATCVRFLEEV